MALSAAPRSLIGRRVRVHWPDDDEWWSGVVENYTTRRGWKVCYDKVVGEDDLVTWHDLDVVQHELVTDEQREIAPANAPVRQQAAAPPPSSSFCAKPGSTSRSMPAPKLPPKPSPCKARPALDHLPYPDLALRVLWSCCAQVAGHQFDRSDESDAGAVSPPSTYGCSLGHMGCSLQHIGLQPRARAVAASST